MELVLQWSIYLSVATTAIVVYLNINRKYLGDSTGKKQLLEILHRLAQLDDNQDERKRQYIDFTHQLEIDSEFISERQPPEEGIEKFNSWCKLEKDITIKAHTEQVELQGDLVQALIAADEKITPEEEVVAEQISSMVEKYANREATTSYEIVIHPKNPEQEKAILKAIAEAKEEQVLGDRALIAGIHRRYREIISESQQEQGWFTVVNQRCISHNTTEHGPREANANVSAPIEVCTS